MYMRTKCTVGPQHPSNICWLLMAGLIQRGQTWLCMVATDITVFSSCKLSSGRDSHCGLLPNCNVEFQSRRYNCLALGYICSEEMNSMQNTFCLGAAIWPHSCQPNAAVQQRETDRQRQTDSETDQLIYLFRDNFHFVWDTKVFSNLAKV